MQFHVVRQLLLQQHHPIVKIIFQHISLFVLLLVSLFALILVTPPLSIAAETTQQPTKQYSKKLVIISSFPEAMGAIYKTAFDAKHPGVKVIITKQKTGAGIKYIKNNPNTVDLFWVSAPDAFEVLKEANLSSSCSLPARR